MEVRQRIAAFGIAALFSMGLCGAPSAYALSWDSTPMTALEGGSVDPATLAGKVVLVVNVASRCGYTSQYTGLQALYERYKDQGLVVVGVPCNQFMGQEPGTATEIASFCKMRYGVTFPLLEKQHVNGSKRSALYRALVDSDVGGGSKVAWNFEKFLVDRSGAVAARFNSGTKPGDASLLSKIEALLAR